MKTADKDKVNRCSGRHRNGHKLHNKPGDLKRGGLCGMWPVVNQSRRRPRQRKLPGKLAVEHFTNMD